MAYMAERMIRARPWRPEAGGMLRQLRRAGQGRPSGIAGDRHHLTAPWSSAVIQWPSISPRKRSHGCRFGRACWLLITGASKGIGLACAMAFASEGARVVGISRDLAHLHAAQHDLQREGLQHGWWPQRTCSDSVAAQMVTEYIENEFGPIDVLVNCAGAAKRTPVAELHADAMHDPMQAKYFTYMHIDRSGDPPHVSAWTRKHRQCRGPGRTPGKPMHIGGGAATAALELWFCWCCAENIMAETESA